MINIPGSVGGDSLSFLAVASGAPHPGSVVEPKTCACGATFYRVTRPADGSEAERWCRHCRANEELRHREHARTLDRNGRLKNPPHLPVAEGALLQAVIDKLRRAS